MILADAYKILGLTINCSRDDVNKAFRTLAAKSHPDVNKDPDAEALYKKMSQAYEVIKKSLEHPPAFDFVNKKSRKRKTKKNWSVNFSKSTSNEVKFDVELSISFRESVLGCVKKISIDKKIHCLKCDGVGGIVKKEAGICNICNGSGSINIFNCNAVEFACNTCRGTGKKIIKCSYCDFSGTRKVKSELDIAIPAGIINEQIVRLANAGDFISRGGVNHYKDLFVKVNVESEKNITLKGNDVVSSIDISLLDALRGTVVQVNTIYGDMSLKIRENTRHRDEVKLSGYGLKKKGDHIFIINVIYPDNVIDLVSFLEKED
jgi:molecular chaperone DnaJ